MSRQRESATRPSASSARSRAAGETRSGACWYPRSAGGTSGRSSDLPSAAPRPPFRVPPERSLRRVRLFILSITSVNPEDNARGRAAHVGSSYRASGPFSLQMCILSGSGRHKDVPTDARTPQSPRTDPRPGSTRAVHPERDHGQFGVNATTVTRWVRSGRITTIRLPGGTTRFRADEIAALLQRDRGDQSLP